MNAMLEHRLRLSTGLVITFFLVLHLLNASLGILSLSTMDAVGEFLFAFWSIPLLSALLYGSFIVHIGLMYVGLYRRRSLRMPGWHILQYILALALPLLLAGHVMGTRGAFQILDISTSYTDVVSILWNSPPFVIKQYALVAVAWTHMSIGIHYWLRHKRGYAQWVPVLYPLCLITPLLAAIGFLRAGIESQATVIDSVSTRTTQGAILEKEPDARAILTTIETSLLWTLALILVAVFVSRAIRVLMDRKRGGFVVSHTTSGKQLSGRRGQTVLDTLREAGIAHASVCGGRGRCTTCRIRITDSINTLPAPDDLETRALQRIGAEPSVRLACQLKPVHDVTITPLLQPNVAAPASRQLAGVVGHERQIVCMFVDMRDSTTLGEQKLPYDVVFILNQFFIQLDSALRETHGHYATFNGDGLMALYGLNDDLATGCRNALEGAVEIQGRIADLNVWLAGELNVPLRVGIGIHCGDAIVGTMGPPNAPTVSAIGDNVNIAARLEALSKEYSTGLVVSEDVLHNAGLPYTGLPSHTVPIRGRAEPLNIVVVDDPVALIRSTPSGPSSS